MFWIMGGGGIFIGLASLTGWPVLEWWAEQLEHVSWNGFHFWDMIFPLFLFIAGISFPFSLAKRIAANESRRSIYKHIVSRGLILVLLGIIYNNGVRFIFADLRYGSVLGRIGMAWMLGALIFLNTKLTFRIIWFWALLIGYWLIMLFFHPHVQGSPDVFSREGNLASYIDRLLLPGKLYLGDHDPEGILSTIPAISTALLGMLTGEFLMSKIHINKPLKRILILVLAGAVLILLGTLWNYVFPINKNLWSSSFVCYAGGLSLLLFTFFHLIIDVWNYKKWAFFFVVIGMNPITIYLAQSIINFESTSNFIFGGAISLFPQNWSPFLNAAAITSVGWLFLYILYRKKIFLKV